MPNRENIAKWADALESGDYEQCASRLRNAESGGWCCLGVACDVARKNGVELVVTRRFDSEVFDGESEYLPPRVREWLGIDTHNPVLDGVPATDLNDAYAMSLAEIASRVRDEYLNGGTV